MAIFHVSSECEKPGHFYICHPSHVSKSSIKETGIAAGIIKQLDRIFRQCLWRGNNDVPKQSLAAWELVCRPRDKGGLGIINLNIQNQGLLLKHLHKFYNKVDVPWVTLIWNSYYDHGSHRQQLLLDLSGGEIF